MSDVTNQSQSQSLSKPSPLEATRVTSHASATRGNWTDVSSATRDKLGIHPEGIPEVFTINNWSPNPIKIVATNGTDMADLSAIDLSVIKAITTTGATTLFWTLSILVTSHGFKTEGVGFQNQISSGQMRVELLTAQSGVLVTLAPTFFLTCGNGTQVTSGTLTNDVFSLISRASLNVQGEFWHC